MTNNETYILDLPFKGDRSYLQGPDIVFSAMQAIGEAQDIVIQMHKMFQKPVALHWTTPEHIAELRNNHELYGVIAYRNLEQVKQYVIMSEVVEQKITKRQKYNEADIVYGSKVIENSIIQTEVSNGNVFERIVALNKILLNSIVEKHAWVFSKISMRYFPLENSSLTIQMVQQAGIHSYKSDINVNNTRVAEVLFTRRPG